jgi:hypothetical protein
MGLGAMGLGRLEIALDLRAKGRPSLFGGASDGREIVLEDGSPLGASRERLSQAQVEVDSLEKERAEHLRFRAALLLANGGIVRFAPAPQRARELGLRGRCGDAPSGATLHFGAPATPRGRPDAPRQDDERQRGKGEPRAHERPS